MFRCYVSFREGTAQKNAPPKHHRPNKLDRAHMIFFQKQLPWKESITISNLKIQCIYCAVFITTLISSLSGFKGLEVIKRCFLGDSFIYIFEAWFFSNPETLQHPNLPTSSVGCFPHQLIVVFFVGVPPTWNVHPPCLVPRLQRWFAPAVSLKKNGRVVQVLLLSMFYVFLCFFGNSELCMIYMEKLAIIRFLLERFILCWLIPKCGSLSKNRLQHLYIYIPLKYTNSKTGCWTRHLGGNTRLQLENPRLKNRSMARSCSNIRYSSPWVSNQSRQLRAARRFGSPPNGVKLLVS